MTSLCVNLVERCNSNRRKLIETTVKVFGENGEDTEHKALDALAIVSAISARFFLFIPSVYIHMERAYINF